MVGHIIKVITRKSYNVWVSQGPRTRDDHRECQTGQAHAQVFVVTKKDAQENKDVIMGTLSAFGHLAKVLINHGARHSFISPQFVQTVNPYLHH